MRITNRTVRHHCLFTDVWKWIHIEELGSGTVLRCDECGQRWELISYSPNSSSLQRITASRAVFLWFFGGAKYQDKLERYWEWRKQQDG